MQEFDKAACISQFAGALSGIENAGQLGKNFSSEGIHRVIFAGCGAPFYLMRLLAYWGGKYAVKTDLRVLHSADLVSQDSSAIDDKTLVVLGSHSGTTRETLDAAKFLQSKNC